MEYNIYIGIFMCMFGPSIRSFLVSSIWREFKFNVRIGHIWCILWYMVGYTVSNRMLNSISGQYFIIGIRLITYLRSMVGLCSGCWLWASSTTSTEPHREQGHEILFAEIGFLLSLSLITSYFFPSLAHTHCQHVML